MRMVFFCVNSFSLLREYNTSLRVWHVWNECRITHNLDLMGFFFGICYRFAEMPEFGGFMFVCISMWATVCVCVYINVWIEHFYTVKCVWCVRYVFSEVHGKYLKKMNVNGHWISMNEWMNWVDHPMNGMVGFTYTKTFLFLFLSVFRSFFLCKSLRACARDTHTQTHIENLDIRQKWITFTFFWQCACVCVYYFIMLRMW